MSEIWIPHDGAQEEFCEAGEFEVLYGGAAGPGKTDCLISQATRHIDKKNYRGLILRRTYPRLEEIVDRCHDKYPPLGGVWREGKSRWTFPSGGSVKLGHMQHEEDKRNYQGKEFQFIGWDELTEFTATQYSFVVNSRTRTSDKSIPVQIRATTNPGGIGHVWVKKHFVDTCDGKVFIDPITGKSRRFIRGLVTDNPTLMENDPEYIKLLAGLPEIERKRLLEGDWTIFEGQRFIELSKQVHGIEPFEIPPEWKRFMVLDWGYAKPFSCGWYAIDYDGVMYRYREYYGCKENAVDEGLRMTAMEVANKINEIERNAQENIRTRIADPSIFDKRPGFRQKEAVGVYINDDFNSQGIFFLKADNDRLQGLQQVHRRFMLEQFVKDTGEIIETPSFVAFNDQVHFWRTLPEIVSDPKKPEDVDTKQEDHIYDEVRYASMFRPVKPKKVEHIPFGSITHEIKKMKRAKQYARRHGVDLSTAYQRIR